MQFNIKYEKKILGINLFSENLELIILSKEQRSLEIINFLSIKIEDKNHSEIFIEIINDFFLKNNLKYSDFSYLFFFNGPGSFIKIRNITSYALGIQFALQNNIKLININLFDVYNFLIKKYNLDHNSSFEKNDMILIIKSHQNFMFIEYFEDNKKFQNLINTADLCNKILEFKNKQIYKKYFFDSIITFEKLDISFKNFYCFEQNISLIKESLGLIFNIINNHDLYKDFFDIKPFYIFEPNFQKNF
jgi:tRNA A37 threonylcarbamoyladenosine modification protein TsaB